MQPDNGFTLELEARYFWKLSQDARADLRAGDAKEAAGVLPDLQAVLSHSPHPAIVGRCVALHQDVELAHAAAWAGGAADSDRYSYEPLYDHLDESEYALTAEPSCAS